MAKRKRKAPKRKRKRRVRNEFKPSKSIERQQKQRLNNAGDVFGKAKTILGIKAVSKRNFEALLI